MSSLCGAVPGDQAGLTESTAGGDAGQAALSAEERPARWGGRRSVPPAAALFTRRDNEGEKHERESVQDPGQRCGPHEPRYVSQRKPVSRSFYLWQ